MGKLNSIHAPNVETIDQINIKEKESDEILNLKDKYWSLRVNELMNMRRLKLRTKEKDKNVIIYK